MRRVTNFHLLHAIVVVILLIGLAAVLSPFDSGEKVLSLGIGILAIIVLGSILAAVLQIALKNRNSVWTQPVSRGVKKLLINSVVSIWLFVVAVFIFMVLEVRGSTKAVIIVSLFLLAGAACGRYLQKRFASDSLLPYGISFAGVLLLILVVLALPGM